MPVSPVAEIFTGGSSKALTPPGWSAQEEEDNVPFDVKLNTLLLKGSTTKSCEVLGTHAASLTHFGFA
jgi:hypothetical protein